MTTPLLILGDAPSAVTGLGRILRDVATRVHAHCPEYEVATLGYGGFGDKTLGFMQYHIESMENWFIPTLPDVWHDFAGDRKGVIMTIWDAPRLLWFSNPALWCPDERTRRWLLNPPFKRWGYFPIDSVGPNGRLSARQRESILGYDRILAYSTWAEQVIRNSISPETAQKTMVTALPHGIDTSVFKPRDRDISRRVFHEQLQFNGPAIHPDEKIIGIVATNQARKDWGLGIETVARVAREHPVRLLIQTDILERHWSIPALLMDYGLIPNAIVNCNPVTDEMMSYLYSACDLTLGIGLGEGFGYPIFESLACGTPCLTGNYGGHAEHMDTTMLLQPSSWRLEGLYNSRRPVFDSEKWAFRINKMLRSDKEAWLPPRLDWTNLWAEWEAWFIKNL